MTSLEKVLSPLARFKAALSNSKMILRENKTLVKKLKKELSNAVSFQVKIERAIEQNEQRIDNERSKIAHQKKIVKK